jgi:hypothetical protein
MTDCIGEVMATQQHHEFHAYRPDEAMVPCSQLLSASNAGLHFEHSDSVPEEWQTRLSEFVLFQGSIFDLTPELLGAVDGVYDRAALVALPAGLRDEYASHLTSLTQAQGQLLICYEYDQACADGPPFSVPEGEVRRLYEGTFAIELLETQSVQGGLKGLCPASEAVWLLR